MIRVDAVRPSAVGDVLHVFRKLPEAALELVDGDGDRASNMARDVLACGPGIENDHIVRSRTPEEFLHANRLCVRTIPEMVAHQPIELGKPVLGNRPDGLAQIAHGGVGEPIVDVEALSAALDERCMTKSM
jgi:hypothetical protein